MNERRRILAVDDHEDMLELIRMTLEGQYDVLTLSNPMDIFELMDVFEPDLLILDVMMPRVTGFQLVEMMRKNAATRDLPIIILSAKTSAGEIKHGYKLGATLYLPKPFQPERLLKNVETEFKIHPPPMRTKSVPIEKVFEHLEQKPSFEKGLIHLTSPLIKSQRVIDARKKIQDRLLKEEQEEKEAKRGWRG